MDDHPIRLKVRVVPGAKRPGVVGRYADGWKVRVTAPPEHGRANQAVAALLARSTGARHGAVRVIAGHGSRDKVVELDGVSREETERRLDAAGQESA